MPRTMRSAKPARTRFLSHALFETLRRNVPYALLIVCAVVAGAVFTVWPAGVLRSLVDGPLTTGAPGLWQYAFQYLGAVLLIGLSDLLREIGATVFAQRMLLNLRKRMLERLRRLPMAYYLGVPAGDTITRFTADIDAVSTLFSSGVVSAAADLLKIGGVILALYALAPALGGIALGAMPVVYLLADIFRRKIYQKQKTVRKKVSDINSGIQEIYTGVRIIKLFGRERRFAARFEPLLEAHRLAMNANSRYDAWFPCVMQIVRAVVIAAILVVGGGFNGTPVALGLSIGTLAAAADLMTRLFDPIEAVATELQTIQQAMAGLSRVNEFFAIETESELSENTAETSPAGDAEVLVENVRFAYPTGGDVLHDTTLRVPAGAKAAIAGRTGSGKTTLLHLVAGLYAPSEGRITIAGQDPYRLPPAARRRLVGVVPQTVTVFNGTLLENVTLRDG
ncbi:MAG TPA: ABC transporter ATP-binding protein, partial [Clostridia bacterium]